MDGAQNIKKPTWLKKQQNHKTITKPQENEQNKNKKKIEKHMTGREVSILLLNNFVLIQKTSGDTAARKLFLCPSFQGGFKH